MIYLGRILISLLLVHCLPELVPQQHEHGVRELDDLGGPVDVERPLQVRVGVPRVHRARLPEAEDEQEGAVDVDGADDEVVNDQDLTARELLML